MLLPFLELCMLFCCISCWLQVIIPLYLGLQLEQFNMIENAISSNSLYSPCSTLNYSQAAMMGLTGSHGSLQDSQQLNYSSHGNIPNIILTGKEITALLTSKPPSAGAPLLASSQESKRVLVPVKVVSLCVTGLAIPRVPGGSCLIPEIRGSCPADIPCL